MISPHIDKLSDAEKKLIKDFLQQYRSLDKDKSQFSENLSNAAGEGQAEPLRQQICLSCISSNLDKIGWLGVVLNLFVQRSTYHPNPINSHIYYSSIPSLNKKSPNSLRKLTGVLSPLLLFFR